MLAVTHPLNITYNGQKNLPNFKTLYLVSELASFYVKKLLIPWQINFLQKFHCIALRVCFH